MKNIFPTLTLFCSLCSFCANAQTILYSESFETDGDGTRYVSNTFNLCAGTPGGNPDYFLRTNTNPALPPGTCTTGHGSALNNVQGSYFWASEDILSSAPTRPPGDITTSLINITGYTTLNVSLYLATANNNNVRWETEDSINIQASINGGTFKTVGRFAGDAVSGGRLRIDTNLDGIAEGTAVDQSTFAQYTFSIPGSGTNLRIKLDFDQLGGTEELGIDLIEVRGTVALPVELLYFGVQKTGRGEANISWKIAEWSSLSHFELEKSSDGIKFQPIKTVVATTALSYQQIDADLQDNLTYYRLKSVEKNGEVAYSQIISLKQNDLGTVNIYPNPASDKFMLEIADEELVGDISCRIFSPVSNYSQVQILHKSVNKMTQEINLENVPKGLYFLNLQSGGQSITKVLVVQ